MSSGSSGSLVGVLRLVLSWLSYASNASFTAGRPSRAICVQSPDESAVLVVAQTLILPAELPSGASMLRGSSITSERTLSLFDDKKSTPGSLKPDAVAAGAITPGA